MKKTLLTLALCAASLMGTASAKLTFNMIDTELLQINGDGTFEEVVAWFEQEQSPFIEFVTLGEGTSIHLGSAGKDSSTVLPYFGTLQMLQGVTFTFDELVTLTHYPNTDGPVFYTGSWIPGELQGDLTLDVSADTLNAWFEQSEDRTHLMKFDLVDKCMFNNTHGPVHCTFAGLKEGQSYEYGDETYENVGIITNEKLLEPGQIALLFRPEPDSLWGVGSFSLVAVGSQYEPVPEPATGTLSLLALAGLAARRRRK